MDKISLKAQKRTILGRKVKSLRKEDLIPAHVFGHNVKSINVSVDHKEFNQAFKKAGETNIIDLVIDGEKKPVLVRGVQKHPVTNLPLHIDFYQVSLKEKVKVDIPLVFIGEAKAVEKGLGVLLPQVSEIEVEALPGDLPEKIEVDVSGLENVGDGVQVKDLKVDKTKVEILADSELTVVNIGELVTKEAEEVLAEEEAERAAAEGEPRPEEGREAAEEAKAEGEEAEKKEEPAEEEEGKVEEKKEETKESTENQE